MNVALIMTAVKHGAVVANYCEVNNLHKDKDGKLTGAKVKDNLTGEEWNVKAKVLIYYFILKEHCLHFLGYHQRNWAIYRYPSYHG